MKSKPTLQELEALLKEDSTPVYILPDGSIMNAQDKQQLEEFIHSARLVVRETGWAAEQIEHNRTRIEAIGLQNLCPPVMHAYDMACAHLTKLDPVGAAEFIRSTYGPSFP